MGQFIAVLLAVAGIIAGPGYFFYTHSFSGKAVGTFEISGRVARLALPGGMGLSFGRAGAFRPVSLDLDPKMNPLSFTLRGTMERRVDAATYRARLFLGSRPVLDKGVWLTRKEKDSDREAVVADVGNLTVESAGQYQFVLEDSSQAGSEKVTGLNIEVRRNVKAPNMRIVWTGVALLVLGCMIGTFSQKPSLG